MTVPNLRAQAKRQQRELKEATAWALRMGFTDAQAPWAALCALRLKVGRKDGPVYAKDVRERLQATVPQLFIDKAQQHLFGEESL